MFYLERSKLAREKQLREEVEREKAALEARLIQYQEEVSYCFQQWGGAGPFSVGSESCSGTGSLCSSGIQSYGNLLVKYDQGKTLKKVFLGFAKFQLFLN